MENFKNIIATCLVIWLSILSFGCKQTEEKKDHKTPMQDNRIKVGILVYPGVELLDFSGPAEVFSNSKYFQVYTISVNPGKVSTKNNTLSMNPDFTISNAPEPDILVLPGGKLEAIGLVSGNRKVMDWITKVNVHTKLTMSVCTGAAILSKAGLLNGKTATTHSGAIDTLQKLTPKARFISNVRFVEDGKILTSAGISAGIDGALHVVEKLKGLKEALFVTSIMEYDKWKPEDGKVIGVTQGMDISKMKQDHTADANADERMAKTTDTEEKDVVCGMTVTMGRSKYFSTYKGKDYHFCSASCKNLFDKNSALYASEN
ncbi:DJ-1/PfpI family protein [Pedobacter sp. MR22-3]|uniref:DJ-1/PfpI family protein n=1 Tax=Pedobacter sp. MR22-3 TaxID=2994552 RepID=UPI00224503C0|nr:DJ-1/PfpI family protein [Pedobacter sp. MR22-3]MCX2584432.1 DJ-1/PfpI family protein [Pedobacter sp. MR22-3]